jgi:hypothetical protein
MRYVTHHFAHLDTLSLARRWLVQLGFDPAQIEIHADGIPRIAVAVRPEQAAEVEMVINAAELTDPNAWPSFWDVAQQEHVYPAVGEAAPEVPLPQTRTSVIGWHPVDRGASGSDDLNSVWDATARFA